ncbi:MerR family transcriptional regulator [Staphylococcus pseudoxylosus]|mgnify:FL=1|uniref:MerR family transcriptional regulator n=2 Tax=Staphylococcus pseudoxylosus TaxID=2282419 RepID=UPI00298FD08A|nr:MerR family transcriptional regulator [Staphylococcus pseudoxylosus]MDW8797864.1 MerR family transcriptional regulator [Staphylococcus pseudoxylosus]MEB6036849.1 MerR family transcriptional regulator [Staphylococcus pseudoxylosus]MEB6043996.1 MerR family transcriptional regulator [Staphylococcus pseudoxylosus]MEB7764664.1 MerR family transcriptional regulator [Staphylococcus pseudoxylosus]MEB8009583.1 MerR family transcriptional regulator [Staphylococcus pseudoxylosus]
MTQYQTGELAKQCNVSIRTIQYYDRKGLLTSTKTEDNGRRVFDEQSKQDLEIVLILKRFGFSLKDIKKIIVEENKLKTIRSMIEQRALNIEHEIQKNQMLLSEIKQFKSYISKNSEAPLNKLLETSQYVANKGNMSTLTRAIVYRMLPMAIVQYTAIVTSIITRKWWPSFVVLPFLMIFAVYFTHFIYKRLKYVCPNCQEVFKPNIKTWLFASHTMKTRKLQCPYCHEISHCMAIGQKMEDSNILRKV